MLSPPCFAHHHLLHLLFDLFVPFCCTNLQQYNVALVLQRRNNGHHNHTEANWSSDCNQLPFDGKLY